MTIAFDAASNNGGGDNDAISFTHTPVGTPRGIGLIIVQNVGATDEIVSVTYGGVPMTPVALSPVLHTVSLEDGAVYGYFLGSGIPTGAQTVAVDVNGTASMKFVGVISVTAAGDTSVLDTSSLSSASVTDPQVSMSCGAADTVAIAGMQHGSSLTSALTPISGFSDILEVDFGAQTGSIIRSTSVVSASTYNMGWTAISNSAAILAMAIREAAGVSDTADQATETDLAQPIAWAPKKRLVGQTNETDLAQGIAATSPDQILVGQANETDLAQAIADVRSLTIGQALETDLAQAIGHPRVVQVGRASETDAAQSIAGTFPVFLGFATETDQAFVIKPFKRLNQATELDRAQQVAVLGGVRVISDAPVLIRAPRKAGRIFHEIVSPSGEGFHPSIAEWSSEEDAPGGFRAASGLISSRIFHAHRETFSEQATWRTFLEDGTCIFAGWLKAPDPDGTMVALSAKGRAAVTDREIGPILYQAHVGSEISNSFSDTDRWRISIDTMSHQNTDTSIVCTRNPDAPQGGNATILIPYLGRDLAFLRMHMQGQDAFISVQTYRRNRLPNPNNSAELGTTGTAFENYFFNFGDSVTAENVAVDLVLASGALPFPNTSLFTNVADIDDTGWGHVWPDLISIFVGDWDETPADSNAGIVLSNIEVNGAPLGSSRRYSVGDLVEDIAARLGFREVDVGGAYDITPYELPPGVPASEALDWACLISGKRYRILDTGSRATFEFGRWDTHPWALASPWSPLKTIPEERFDAVAIPYQYPGTHGQLTDQVIVRVDDSPLLKRRVAWGYDLGQPSHNRDKAIDLGSRIADDLVRRHFTGDFAAAELTGPDGQKVSAHHANAGDVLRPWRGHEPGALRIGRLTRFDDHVEGEFDSEGKHLEQLIARRDKRISDRNG